MMEFSISLILILVSLFILNTSYFLIILFVSINILVTNIVTYYEFISQITMRFKRTTVRSIIKSSLNILAVGILFLLFTYNNVVIYNYVYVAITLTISGFLALWYIISYREITFGRGTSLKEERSIIVPNVNEFKGHIACSSKSKSEIVVPIKKDNKVVALIDIDSPIYNRFSESDKLILEDISSTLSELF